MITASDSYNTWDLGKYYVILPQSPRFNLDEFVQSFNAIKVQEGFNYNSGQNDDWETVDSLRDLIVEHVDPDFSWQ
jgi:hypothetical protein